MNGRFGLLPLNQSRQPIYRSLSHSAQLLWHKLRGSPSRESHPALYPLSRVALADEAQYTLDQLDAAMTELVTAGVARVDWDACLIYLPQHLSEQPPESPNQAKGYASSMHMMPRCELLLDAIRDTLRACQDHDTRTGRAYQQGHRKRPAERITPGFLDKLGDELTAAALGEMPVVTAEVNCEAPSVKEKTNRNRKGCTEGASLPTPTAERAPPTAVRPGRADDEATVVEGRDIAQYCGIGQLAPQDGDDLAQLDGIIATAPMLGAATQTALDRDGDFSTFVDVLRAMTAPQRRASVGKGRVVGDMPPAGVVGAPTLHAAEA